MTACFAHGLVIGKFYPPHLGHDELIDVAAEQCDHVSVLVMAARTESLPLADRMTWIRATHAHQPTVSVIGVPCDAPVDFTSPFVWAAQEALMRAALRPTEPPHVDAVFSSEAYGDELAARLGATHVPFDPARTSNHVSGSRVRADLAGHWDSLSAPTRAGLVTRVVVVGAESTGTTTVAERLAERYRLLGGVWDRTQCVGEFGRELTLIKLDGARAVAASSGGELPRLEDLVWTTDDFDLVGTEQTRREEQVAVSGSPLLVCDTDAFATTMWERRYLAEQARDPQPWATALLPRRDLYFLTSHDGVPWLDDGLREGDLDVRAVMTGWFEDALTAAGHSWVLLTGTPDDRVALAVRVTDYLLAHRFRFGPAITDSPTSDVD